MKRSAFLALIVIILSPAMALTKAPTKPLKDRVSESKTVFVGKLIDKEIKGEWVHAKLLVEEPLKGVKRFQKVAVIWRKTLGNLTIYDADEGAKGIAILKDKHEGRYWLRADKFEPLSKLEEVKRLVK